MHTYPIISTWWFWFIECLCCIVCCCVYFINTMSMYCADSWHPGSKACTGTFEVFPTQYNVAKQVHSFIVAVFWLGNHVFVEFMCRFAYFILLTIWNLTNHIVFILEILFRHFFFFCILLNCCFYLFILVFRRIPKSTHQMWFDSSEVILIWIMLIICEFWAFFVSVHLTKQQMIRLNYKK